MSFWPAVLIASAVSFAIKLAGHLVPASWMRHPRIVRISAFLPAALLGALVVVQTFASGRHLEVDARLAGVLVAAVAFRLKAPFVVAVFLAALTAAALRAVGAP